MKSVQLVSTDFNIDPFGPGRTAMSIPDTARVWVSVDSACDCNETTLAMAEFESYEQINMPFGEIRIQNGNGTHTLIHWRV